jgi:hypothetical protein
MFRPDGSFMPHNQCPMAEVLSDKISELRDAEVLIERLASAMSNFWARLDSAFSMAIASTFCVAVHTTGQKIGA